MGTAFERHVIHANRRNRRWPLRRGIRSVHTRILELMKTVYTILPSGLTLRSSSVGRLVGGWRPCV